MAGMHSPKPIIEIIATTKDHITISYISVVARLIACPSVRNAPLFPSLFPFIVVYVLGCTLGCSVSPQLEHCARDNTLVVVQWVEEGFAGGVPVACSVGALPCSPASVKYSGEKAIVIK